MRYLDSSVTRAASATSSTATKPLPIPQATSGYTFDVAAPREAVAPITWSIVAQVAGDTIAAKDARTATVTLGTAVTATRFVLVRAEWIDAESGLTRKWEVQYRLTVGAPPSVVTIPSVTPAAAWNGAGGSGFAGNVPAQTGTAIASMPEIGSMHGTVAPTAHWLQPCVSDQAFLADQYVAVTADAASANGCDGIANVRFHVEGTIVDVAQTTVIPIKRNGFDVLTDAFVIKLPHALIVDGAIDIYATITPVLAGVATRVIGPMRLYRRAAPDRTISIAPGQAAVAGVSYPSLKAALDYLASAPEVALTHVNLAADYRLDLGDAAQIPSNAVAATAARRGTTVIRANGFDFLVTNSGTLGTSLRPMFNGLVFEGQRFDMTRIGQLYSETGSGTSAGFRRPLLRRCSFFQSNAPDFSYDGGMRGTPIVRAEWAIEDCHFFDITLGDFTATVRLNCTARNVIGDFGHMSGIAGSGQPFPVLYRGNDVEACGATLARTPRNAIQLAYGGAGAATYDITGATSNDNRTLTLKVDNVAAQSFTAGTYRWPADLVAAINAYGNGWTATLLNNTRRTAYIGPEGSALGEPVDNVITTTLWMHVDTGQLNGNSHHENVMMWDNIFRDSDAQLIFACMQDITKTGWNVSIRRNAGNLSEAAQAGAQVSQISGQHNHLLFDGNTIMQGLWLRFDRAAQWGFLFDSFSRLTNNIASQILGIGSGGTLAGLVRGNHTYNGMSGIPAGANVAANTTGGTMAGDFDSVSRIADRRGFLPRAGAAVRGFLADRARRYDLGGTRITAPTFAGAIVADAPATTLPAATIDTAYLDEASAAGTLVGTLAGAAGATWKLLDNAGGRFALNDDKVVAGATPTDYETTRVHDILIRQIVGASHRDEWLRIDVIDKNEAFIPRNWNVAGLGTSVVDRGLSGNSFSGTAGFTARDSNTGFMHYLARRTGHRLRLARRPNFGIGGSNGAQIIADPRKMNTGAVTSNDWWRGGTSTEKGLKYLNPAAAAAAGIPAHHVCDAGVVVIRALTNDGSTALATQQGYIQAIDAALPADTLRVYCSETATGSRLPGTTGGSGNGAPQTTKDMRDWLQSYCAQAANRLFVDCWTPSTTATAAPYLNTNGKLIDGLHDTVGFCDELALAVHNALTARYGATYLNLPRRVPRFDAGNDAEAVNNNPRLTGTGGSIGNAAWYVNNVPTTALIPQNWTLTPTSATYPFDVIVDRSLVDEDGSPILKLVVQVALPASSGSAVSALLRLSTTSLRAGVPALTDKLMAVAQARFDPGSQHFMGFELGVQVLGSPNGARQFGFSGTPNAGNNHMGLHMAEPPYYDMGSDTWQDLATQVIDLADPALPAAGQTLTSISGVTTQLTMTFSNTTNAAVTGAATIYVKKIGTAKINSAFGGIYA